MIQVCAKCGETKFSFQTHICPPKWAVFWADEFDVEENCDGNETIVFAPTAQNAAIAFVDKELWDYEAGTYQIVVLSISDFIELQSSWMAGDAGYNSPPIDVTVSKFDVEVGFEASLSAVAV